MPEAYDEMNETDLDCENTIFKKGVILRKPLINNYQDAQWI